MVIIEDAGVPTGLHQDRSNRIATIIAAHSANDVPPSVVAYGLLGQRDEAMSGKFRYVSNRLFELSDEVVLATARKVSQEEGDQVLIDLLASIQSKVPAPSRGSDQLNGPTT
jgi:hypothetical protein